MNTARIKQNRLHKLFVDELQDIYWAERALTRAIPDMIANASDEDLIKALTSHLEETKEHVIRLEDVFATIGEFEQAKFCEAMDGLIREAERIISDTEAGAIRDAGIISAAQKVEHYEIAAYSTLCSFAVSLGELEAEELLRKTLEEEKNADEVLTEITDIIQSNMSDETHAADTIA